MRQYRFPPIEKTPADEALKKILDHIGVPASVLQEAKARRNLVVGITLDHDGARDHWYSGSVEHRTENNPLGDADCGTMMNRRPVQFQRFGPDGSGLGPRLFIDEIANWLQPKLVAVYPNVQLDLEGKRAITIYFNEQIDDDELGAVDPSVDLILGLERINKPGIWIPNCETDSWDAADPMKHTALMTTGPAEIVAARAHLIRLAKRAVKREEKTSGVATMCSWNISALALECVESNLPLSVGLQGLFTHLSARIAEGPTEDPAGVSDPIRLPDGMSHEEASQRLASMAQVVALAQQATSVNQAEEMFETLFGVELIEEMRAKNLRLTRNPVTNALKRGDHGAASLAVGGPSTFKRTYSGGDRW